MFRIYVGFTSFIGNMVLCYYLYSINDDGESVFFKSLNEWGFSKSLIIFVLACCIGFGFSRLIYDNEVGK